MQSECLDFDPKTAQIVVSNALYWVLELCRQMWMAINTNEGEDKFKKWKHMYNYVFHELINYMATIYKKEISTFSTSFLLQISLKMWDNIL